MNNIPEGNATIRKFRIVQTEGMRQINREIDFYCSDLQTESSAIGQQLVARLENESR